ncbi:hypothetical protein J0871_17015 [Salegentibacter sp. BDJ18]|uniref:hypothetical protein n=1 Tax=Salegentibacter sp. BDJ18 TaxID=2816376 RepID=UPI001AAF8155|nr:hypothetical protein [Salegentibacter sp. BDJ18]MBO2546120.1 hypothetical protein [Salegentibacter sp. BDJ18]
MILIPELRQYVTDTDEALPEVNFSKVVVVKEELAKFLSGVRVTDNQIMIAVMPDARTTGNDVDALKLRNSLGFFFLEKTDYSATRQDEWLDVFERTQATALKFFNKVLDDSIDGPCGFVRDLVVSNISINPESNLLGCNGWSVELSFDTSV